MSNKDIWPSFGSPKEEIDPNIVANKHYSVGSVDMPCSVGKVIVIYFIGISHSTTLVW